MNTIKVFTDADEIAAEAAEYVLDAARDAIAQRGVFNIVLSGGSTPRKLYELLAGREADWDRWHFFMGDERFVAQDDERSNQKMANDTLLSKLAIDKSQIHPVPTDRASVEQAAADYEAEIKGYFGDTAVPAFDLILLGMGSDAHTASLFPGKPALQVTDRLVVASEPGVLPPPVNRVTFTFPLLNAAHRVLFLTAGQDKAEAFQAVRQDLERDSAQATTPAGKVRPEDGELVWFVDQTASARSN